MATAVGFLLVGEASVSPALSYNVPPCSCKLLPKAAGTTAKTRRLPPKDFNELKNNNKMPLFDSCWNCSRFRYFFFSCSLLLVRLSGCSLQPLLSGFIIIKRKASGNGTLWFACKFSHWIFPLMGCTATTPQPLMRTGTFCCFRNDKDGQRPEHSVLMDALSNSRVI